MGCGGNKSKHANLTIKERAEKVKAYLEIFDKTNDEGALKDAFDCFDLNADKKLNVEELRAIISTLDGSVNEARKAFKYDANNDGFIDYEEFLKFVK